jgi:hypothetical protein
MDERWSLRLGLAFDRSSSLIDPPLLRQCSYDEGSCGVWRRKGLVLIASPRSIYGISKPLSLPSRSLCFSWRPCCRTLMDGSILPSTSKKRKRPPEDLVPPGKVGLHATVFVLFVTFRPLRPPDPPLGRLVTWEPWPPEHVLPQ